MVQKFHILFFIAILSFLMMPKVSHACETKVKTACCKQKKDSKTDCCKKNNPAKNSKQDNNCGGKCSKSCHNATNFSLLPLAEANNISIYFFIIKQKFCDLTISLPRVFFNIWIPPKIA